MLSEKEILTMHSKAFELLEKNGVRFDTEESLELFRKSGFKVENGRVYMTGNDVEKAYALNEKTPAYQPGSPKYVSASAIGTVPTLYDYDENRVIRVTLKDVETSYKLQMTSPLYGDARCNLIEPIDLDSKHPHIGQLAMALKHVERGIKVRSLNRLFVY